MYVAAYSGITSSLILQYSVFDLIQLFFFLFLQPYKYYDFSEWFFHVFLNYPVSFGLAKCFYLIT